MKLNIPALVFFTVIAFIAKDQRTLVFNASAYHEKTIDINKTTLTIRAYENIVYVANPADTNYEVMNIYIPAAYFEGKSLNGYTAANAPIFFPNQIGGYMPGKPATTNSMGNEDEGGNTVKQALLHGYVVASAGARGRTLPNGKSPAALVDLKAAVRYLKFNDKAMPGDANKIISNGTSAGGAMSALLGATGNNDDYTQYLQSIDPADGTDDIFAVSAYCPITNLDNADMAYEWQFYGLKTANWGSVKPLTQSQLAISKDLKKEFPAYINSLKLKDDKGKPLTLNAAGDGSFKEWVKQYLIASANTDISKGNNLSAHTWLTFTNGKVTGLDWGQYMRYIERMKMPPAFDALDLSTPESQEFGTATIDKQHFTPYGTEHSTVAGATIADKSMVKMLNPMYYIGLAGTNTAKYWRIRHGSKDRDGSLAVPVILATLLQNNGYSVNLALPWDVPHSGDYDLNELFSWIDSICRQ